MNLKQENGSEQVNKYTNPYKKMLGFSGSKDSIKKNKSQYSFTTLSQSTTGGGQYTKKTIQAEDIVQYQAESIKDSRISFSLPYHAEISVVISHLINLFSEDIIHVEEDNQGGKVLLHGARNESKRKYLINMLDCLGLCCWKFGLNGGSLYESYSVVSISIRKQILNNRCVIMVQQLPYHADDKKVFMQKIVNKIQQQLKKVDIKEERSVMEHSTATISTKYLSLDSIFLQEIDIKEKLYNIFVYTNDKKWSRFRRLFKKSYENLKQKIHEYKANNIHINQNEHHNTLKKNKQQPKHKKHPGPNPSSLLQAIITETDSLYRVLLNYYEKQVEQHTEHTVLASMLQSPVQKQFTLYSIQQLIASQFMGQVLECYQSATEQQSEVFNRNAKEITSKFSNRQCFDYLELRNKFRLLESDHPYHPSIQILKNIPNSTCPREMLMNIQKVFSSVKVDCLKASKGRTQLSSMDDLLPVMIFVTAKASVHNFPAYVKLVDDYVRLKEVFELEERIITTLYVAVEDITKKWNA